MTGGPDLFHGIIGEIWYRLQCVRHLRILAASEGPSEIHWSGSGDGTVNVQDNGPLVIFNETGIWRTGQVGEVHFGNVYRWSRAQDHIGLEHLLQRARV
ncbi:MAG: hypothetical protein LAO21_05075 [Acidobacteriia bacterium]|nr:hypothetical protein [Terriglobia bacterium]